MLTPSTMTWPILPTTCALGTSPRHTRLSHRNVNHAMDMVCRASQYSAKRALWGAVLAEREPLPHFAT